jgi:hypothetical protein
MRKVYVTVTARLIINMDDGVDVEEVINDMDYSFNYSGEGADIVEEEILDYEVIDSK